MNMYNWVSGVGNCLTCTMNKLLTEMDGPSHEPKELLRYLEGKMIVQ